jgi:anti-sigma B factor antagonist
LTSQPPRFELLDRDAGDRARVIEVSGELDISSAPDFRNLVEARLGDGSRDLIVDLSKAQFIDSSGVQVLINAYKQLDENGARLLLVCTNPPMLDLFRLTGLDEMCAIVSSRAEAEARTSSA